MKNYFLFILLIFFFIEGQLFAQKGTLFQQGVASVKVDIPIGNKPTSSGFNGTGANMNVIYHRANWKVDPNKTANKITGSVTTYFKTIESNVSAINFDLSKSSFNNASLHVTWHGILCATNFPTTGNVNVLNISLPSVIAAPGTLDSIVIEYSGVPGPGGLSGGLPALSYTDQFGATQRYLLTLSESYEDKNWWPCKADMQDKIDSIDINVTVPWKGTDTFWVASNGRLVDSAITDTLRTFKYQSRHPVASYLVCFAAAKYNRYYRNVMVGNSNVPVAWYLLAGKAASYYNNAISAMTTMNSVLQGYSRKLGDYPFKDEKHGYYDGLNGASGMEHQTFSAIASIALTSTVTLDHELMHQWFGDNVTFATWNDLWLAEGFARYGEILAAELVNTLGYTAHARRSFLKGKALELTSVSLWIPNSNIGTSDLIWHSGYSSAVYERGSMIVSMLRTICGDEKFFKALTIYQTRLSGKAANADSLKNIFNEVTGADLSAFFNDYVGGSGPGDIAVGGIGNPVYQVKWNSPSPGQLIVGVQSQNKTPGSNVNYFNGPVVVHAKGSLAAQDTTVIFYDHGNGDLSYSGNGISAPVSNNALAYQLSFTPVSVFYDDSARTLSTGIMVLDSSMKGYTWYGAKNNNWFDADNWAACCGTPPTNADITIATVGSIPQIPSLTTIRNLIINDGKSLNVGSNTLTINGAVLGKGAITGSSFSNIVINGKGSTLRFTQDSSQQRFLQSLIMGEGSSAILVSDADVENVIIKPGANFVVAPGVTLVTH
jgi:hypothetical protein